MFDILTVSNILLVFVSVCYIQYSFTLPHLTHNMYRESLGIGCVLSLYYSDIALKGPLIFLYNARQPIIPSVDEEGMKFVV